MCWSRCPRARSRATMRACATAAAVHAPPPSTSGITPLSAQRLSVDGETPTRAAASERVRVGSATDPSLCNGGVEGSLRRRAGVPARSVGRWRRGTSRSLQVKAHSIAAKLRVEGALNYFVTGATGFIGRHLLAELLKREGTIYVLVREGSRGKIDALVQSLGAEEGRIAPVTGDLSKPGLGIEGFSEPVEHFFHLAAIYDMAADEAAME